MKSVSPKIKSFTDLYEQAISSDKILSDFLTGHLVVEFMLRKIIEISQPNLIVFSENLTHAKIIQFVHGLGLINDKQKEVLQSINSLRNKFAHQISYFPEIKELQILFEQARKAFSDLTDGIEQGLGEMKGKKSFKECEDWVISEFFIQISYDLHSIYHDLGGDIEEF